MNALFSTLIISTYNSPKFLSLVLDSLRYQTSFDFELIIADDGSTDETRQLIESFKQSAPFSVIHLWHEDKGWQKSQIHNKAIALAKYDHLIFIDGDCILAPGFISDHQSIYKREQSNYLLMGRRVELGPRLSKKLTLINYRSKILSFFSLSLLYSALQGDSRGALRRHSIKSPFMRKLFKANNVHDLLGCNFSTTKSDMISINGFNDDYERGEDGDIFVRMRNSRKKIIGMKYFIVMFHLDHYRRNCQDVDDHYEQNLLPQKEYMFCKNGLDKYLNQGIVNEDH